MYTYSTKFIKNKIEQVVGEKSIRCQIDNFHKNNEISQGKITRKQKSKNFNNLH